MKFLKNTGKGQMFMILAIIIILVMILTKSSLDITTLIEKKKHLEANLERLEFQNILSEWMKTVQISYTQPTENITNNVNNFIKFSRQCSNARAVNLNGILIEAVHGTVQSSIDTGINITVLNLLSSSISRLNVTFDDDQAFFSDVADGMTVYQNFTFNTAINQNYTLTVTYNTSVENVTRRITIPTEIGKSKYVAFIDLRMISNKIEQRDVITKVYTL
jgi:hypothetical protein